MAMTSLLLYWVPNRGCPLIISNPSTPRDHMSAAGDGIMLA